MADDSPLISTQELEARLGAPDLRVLDCSWRLDGTDMRAAFAEAHIPGAVFFDIDAVSDRSSDLPHMLPAPEDFAAMAGALGISKSDHIVVYDDGGFFSAPRVWWTFRAMGAGRVQVLHGGLPAWKAEGRTLESGAADPAPAEFTPRFDAAMVRDFRAMLGVVDTGDEQIVDSRPADRFRAEAPEPRPGLRGGHMPGARCLPLGELYANGRLKDAADLEAAFAAAGVDPARPVVATCGSGVAASSVSLALAAMGRGPGAVYDGSWSEWGGRDEAPVVTGPPSS